MRSNRSNSNTTTKSNVLIVTDYYFPHWTGISKSIYNLVKVLKDRINFKVLTVRYDKSLLEVEKINGVEVQREDYLFSLSRAKYSLSLVWRFVKAVNKFDTILINSPFTNILPVTALAKFFGKKVVIVHQGDLTLPEGFKNRIIEKMFDLATIGALFLADKVSTYTTDYATNSRVLKFFMKKFTPVMLPIILEKVDTTKKNPAISKISELRRKHRYLFGFGGRFVHEKGFDILFDSIPSIVKNIPDAHFIFVGETDMKYENFFEKNSEKIGEIKNNLTFIGLLKEGSLTYFYENIDCLIVPSRTDCFPLMQAEACLAGTLSLVSDSPGVRMLVKQTGFGLIFERENSDDLADKLIQLVNNTRELKKNYPNVVSLLNVQKIGGSIRKYLES